MYTVVAMECYDRSGNECSYTGEVDQDGLVCGDGVVIPVRYPDMKFVEFKVTCLNGKEQGIRK